MDTDDQTRAAAWRAPLAEPIPADPAMITP
jgi:hypothetical protein